MSADVRYVTVQTAARRLQLPVEDVIEFCVLGRVVGARFVPAADRWFVPVPVQMLWSPARG